VREAVGAGDAGQRARLLDARQRQCAGRGCVPAPAGNQGLQAGIRESTRAIQVPSARDRNRPAAAAGCIGGPGIEGTGAAGSLILRREGTGAASASATARGRKLSTHHASPRGGGRGRGRSGAPPRKIPGPERPPARVAVNMPPITPVPMAMAAVGAGAGGNRQRQHAEHEGDRGHQDRPEAQAAGLERGLDQVLALLLQFAGELDDQDRVLRRKADDGDQADLEIHVVGQAAQAARRAPRRRSPAAPPASPRRESTSFRTARRGTGTPRPARPRTGRAPGCRRAVSS
jgi:hypothetical protein